MKPTLKVSENQLYLEADAFRMKVIAEAIADYTHKHQLEGDKMLNDFYLNMQTAYQRFYDLHENDLAYIEKHREFIHGAF